MDELDLSDNNHNGVPDIFENRRSIVEILNDEYVATPPTRAVAVKKAKAGALVKASKPKALDNRWAETQHWRKGDRFDSDIGHGLYTAEFIALADDEYAYCWKSCAREQKVKVPIKDLVGHNESYRSRKIDEEMSRKESL